MHKTFDPVFSEGEIVNRPSATVPNLVDRLVKSFRDRNGAPATVEMCWLYTGTTTHQLDVAWFPQTIGVLNAPTMMLDRLLDETNYIYPALGFQPESGELGVQFTVVPPSAPTDGITVGAPGLFVSYQKRLICDRHLTQYLKPFVRSQLSTKYGLSSGEATDTQLIQFILSHEQRCEASYPRDEPHRFDKVIYIPNSMSISSIATEISNHPTRAFVEPAMRANRYQEDGNPLFADGHIHRALTERHINGDPWLTAFARRYGPQASAGMLSLFDADVILRMEHLGANYGLPAFTHAARELYVVDDNAELVGHSVLNVSALWSDEQRIGKFFNLTWDALKAPKDPDRRFAYHDMMMEYTKQKGIAEALSPRDYRP